MRIPLILVAALCCLTLTACRSGGGPGEPQIPVAPSELRGDYLRIQGTWVVLYNENKGIPLPERAGHVFIFEKDQSRIGKHGTDERFALDETSVPKRIEFDDGRSPILRGIYRLDADRLTICTISPGHARPREFKTSLFSTAVLTHLQRLPHNEGPAGVAVVTRGR
ncbi:MAG: TIGR03067 domain-containing protein [Burkholderiales bacterium]|nr:TIGR03067 domain-containing protein [Phycisphaerae bacterium]